MDFDISEESPSKRLQGKSIFHTTTQNEIIEIITSIPIISLYVSIILELIFEILTISLDLIRQEVPNLNLHLVLSGIIFGSMIPIMLSFFSYNKAYWRSGLKYRSLLLLFSLVWSIILLLISPDQTSTLHRIYYSNVLTYVVLVILYLIYLNLKYSNLILKAIGIPFCIIIGVYLVNHPQFINYLYAPILITNSLLLIVYIGSVTNNEKWKFYSDRPVSWSSGISVVIFILGMFLIGTPQKILIMTVLIVNVILLTLHIFSVFINKKWGSYFDKFMLLVSVISVVIFILGIFLIDTPRNNFLITMVLAEVEQFLAKVEQSHTIGLFLILGSIFLASNPRRFFSQQRAYLRHLSSGFRHDRLVNIASPTLQETSAVNKIRNWRRRNLSFSNQYLWFFISLIIGVLGIPLLQGLLLTWEEDSLKIAIGKLEILRFINGNINDISLLELMALGLPSGVVFSLFYLLIWAIRNRQKYIVFPLTVYGNEEEQHALAGTANQLIHSITDEIRNIGQLMEHKQVNNANAVIGSALAHFTAVGVEPDFVSELKSLTSVENIGGFPLLGSVFSFFINTFATVKVRGSIRQTDNSNIEVWIELNRNRNSVVAVDKLILDISNEDIDELTLNKISREIAIKLILKLGQSYHLATDWESFDFFLDGLAAAKDRNWWRAIEAYESAVQSEEARRETFGIGHYHLGATFLSLGEIQKALQHFEQAQVSGPPIPETYYMIAVAETYLNWGKLNTSETQSKFHQIVEYSNLALRLRPHFSEVHHLLGSAYYHRAKLNEREHTKRYETGEKPSIKSVRSWLDEYRNSIKHFRRAIHFYDKELESVYLQNSPIVGTHNDVERLLQSRMTATHQLADALRSLSLFAEADTYYHDVLAVYPTNSRTLFDISKNYCMAEQWQRAEEFIYNSVLTVPELEWTADANLYAGWALAGGVAQDWYLKIPNSLKRWINRNNNPIAKELREQFEHEIPEQISVELTLSNKSVQEQVVDKIVNQRKNEIEDIGKNLYKQIAQKLHTSFEINLTEEFKYKPNVQDYNNPQIVTDKLVKQVEETLNNQIDTKLQKYTFTEDVLRIVLGKAVNHIDFAIHQRPRFLSRWLQTDWLYYFEKAAIRLDSNQINYKEITKLPIALEKGFYSKHLCYWLSWRMHSLDYNVSGDPLFRLIPKELHDLNKHSVSNSPLSEFLDKRDDPSSNDLVDFVKSYQQFKHHKRLFSVVLEDISKSGRLHGMAHAWEKLQIAASSLDNWKRAQLAYDKILYKLRCELDTPDGPPFGLRWLFMMYAEISVFTVRVLMEAWAYETAWYVADKSITIMHTWVRYFKTTDPNHDATSQTIASDEATNTGIPQASTSHRSKYPTRITPYVFRYNLATLYSTKAYCAVAMQKDRETNLRLKFYQKLNEPKKHKIRKILKDYLRTPRLSVIALKIRSLLNSNIEYDYHALPLRALNEAQSDVSEALRFLPRHQMALFVQAKLYQRDGLHADATNELYKLLQVIAPYDPIHYIANWEMVNKPNFEAMRGFPEVVRPLYGKFQEYMQAKSSGQDIADEWKKLEKELKDSFKKLCERGVISDNQPRPITWKELWHCIEYNYYTKREQDLHKQIRTRMRRQGLVSGQEHLSNFVNRSVVHKELADILFSTKNQQWLGLGHLSQAAIWAKYADEEADYLLEYAEKLDLHDKFRDVNAVLARLRARRYFLESQTFSLAKDDRVEVLEIIIQSRLENYSAALSQGSQMWHSLFRKLNKMSNIADSNSIKSYFDIYTSRLANPILLSYYNRTVDILDKENGIIKNEVVASLNDFFEEIKSAKVFLDADQNSIDVYIKFLMAFTKTYIKDEDALNIVETFYFDTEFNQGSTITGELISKKEAERFRQEPPYLNIAFNMGIRMLDFLGKESIRSLEQIVQIANNIAYNRAELGFDYTNDSKVVDFNQTVNHYLGIPQENISIIQTIIQIVEKMNEWSTKSENSEDYHYDLYLMNYYDTWGWIIYSNIASYWIDVIGNEDSKDAVYTLKVVHYVQILSKLNKAKKLLFNHAMKYSQHNAIVYYHLAQVHIAMVKYLWQGVDIKDSQQLSKISPMLRENLTSAQEYLLISREKDVNERITKSLNELNKVIVHYQDSWNKISSHI